MRLVKVLLMVALTATIVACGGGGGSAGTVTSGGGSTSTTTSTVAINTPTLSVTDFVLAIDKTAVNNNGVDVVALTVTALDSNRNVVPGAEVKVTVGQGTVFTPSAGTATIADGTFKGAITIGSDKTDRDVTVTAVVNNLSKRTSFRIVGSKLTVSVVPANPTPGQAGTVTAALVDFSGVAIPGSTITLGGSIAGLVNQTAVTSIGGIATRTFTAPAASGVYVVNGSGGGVLAADVQVRVFDVNVAVPVAVIPAGATPSLATSPNVLPVNSAGSTVNRSTLRFLFLDSATNPVQNVRVRFENLTTGLPAVGSSITTAGQTLYTDASGVANAQFVAGQNTSSTNGVVIRACYKASDFVSATDCPNSVIAFLTVAGQALAVSIGDDNLLSTSQPAGTYIKRFAVTVADSAGKPVPNAPVDLSVDLTHYGKQSFWRPNFAVPQSLTASSQGTSTITVNGVSSVVTGYWCANEDTNRNGVVDAGENLDGSLDTNGQPTIEPRKSDLLISYNDPAVTTTNASGVLVIKVEYSQRFGGWLNYRIRATTSVLGSQGQAERAFVTDVLNSDVPNGSFLTPPYGVQSCATSG